MTYSHERDNGHDDHTFAVCYRLRLDKWTRPRGTDYREYMFFFAASLTCLKPAFQPLKSKEFESLVIVISSAKRRSGLGSKWKFARAQTS